MDLSSSDGARTLSVGSLGEGGGRGEAQTHTGRTRGGHRHMQQDTWGRDTDTQQNTWGDIETHADKVIMSL